MRCFDQYIFSSSKNEYITENPHARFVVFLAALAALCIPTLGRHSLSQCHFKIWTQIIDKKTKRQKDKKTKRQIDKKTKRQKTKTNREFNIAMSGQFHPLAMFCTATFPNQPGIGHQLRSASHVDAPQEAACAKTEEERKLGESGESRRRFYV